MARSEKHEAIYATVMAIPAGHVSTYGQVARAAGLPGQARLVGYALHALPSGSSIPWHRVINARGEISLPLAGAGERQRECLEAEGVAFGLRGRIDLARFGWSFDAD
ncbi:methylated-DNA-protein-cysteine methyltransferase-like protein [Natronospira proteinivora]|uniref:Methylated-DNA-protein-cysteine methyltransferase-like protein n=1 Tax=Natronospira proteinivora TaxID=1807133 RepID=A0ABT1GA61_9GAMM|nr:MGMT family protein [Natronospira proteinivora]MCP1728211.1 methylated-DNA-protein-cysteine methyltransferase-like protein [Natronospira proteinivora]